MRILLMKRVSMENNKIIFILAVLFFFTFSLIPTVIAHGEEDSASALDIHFTPLQAFQGNEVAIEAEIIKNGTPVESLNVFFVVDKHDIGLSERLETKEREPGHYFTKYAFKNSGEYEIHVEFLHESETIRKTFNISVAGGGNEGYFLVVAVFLVALTVLHGMKSRKIKRTLILSLLILAATGLSYSVYILYSSGAASQGVVVCTTSTECYWSAHVHAEVNVNMCGKEFRFPVEKGRLDGPHTHEEKNLIHWHDRLKIDPSTKEILDPSSLTLGAFFDAMEMNLSETQIGDMQNGDLCNGPSTLKMYVNGKPSASFRDYIWKDGDKISFVFDEKPAEAVEKEEQKATFLAPELTLPIIIGFALIDSINPCVIGVLLLLITILLKTKKRRAVLVNGSVYTLGVYATYLIGGVTLLSIFNAVRSVQLVSQMFYVVIGAFILLAAFLEIKDYFWYGRGFSLAIPKRFVSAVEGNVKNTHSSLLMAFLFGSLVTLIELPCTGAPYLAIITIMSQSGVQFYNAIILLLLYNLVFVIPLIVIIYLGYKGVGYKRMEMWRREHKGKMRLAVGLMLLGISTWIITTVLDWLFIYLIAGAILVIAGMYIVKKIGQRTHHLESYKNRVSNNRSKTKKKKIRSKGK